MTSVTKILSPVAEKILAPAEAKAQELMAPHQAAMQRLNEYLERQRQPIEGIRLIREVLVEQAKLLQTALTGVVAASEAMTNVSMMLGVPDENTAALYESVLPVLQGERPATFEQFCALVDEQLQGKYDQVEIAVCKMCSAWVVTGISLEGIDLRDTKTVLQQYLQARPAAHRFQSVRKAFEKHAVSLGRGALTINIEQAARVLQEIAPEFDNDEELLSTLGSIVTLDRNLLQQMLVEIRKAQPAAN